jgi:type 1 glutamine amidotransferase
MRPVGLALVFSLPLLVAAGCDAPSEAPEPAAGGASATGAGGAAGVESSGGAGSPAGSAGAVSGAGGSAGGGAGASSGGSSSGAAGAAAGSSGGSFAGAGGSSNAAGEGPGGAGVGGLAGGASGSGGNGGSGGSAGNAGAGGSGNTRPSRVLLYSFSTLDIPSVPAQLTLLQGKLESFGYQVDRSVDPAVFTDASLARYAAVGMINTCFYPFGANNTTGEPQSQALQRFLQQGGGLFGTHCADVTFQSAAQPVLYNRLIGGRASSENFDGRSDCRKMGDHPTISELPATFSYTGNLDNTNFIASDATVLVRCRWTNSAMTDVAVSWVRNEGAGRVFFTNFGKVDADLTNATIGDAHIVAGLAWVLGAVVPLR